MEQSESIDELTIALVRAKIDFAALVPDKVNPHFKSKYPSLQECYKVSDPALLANGLIVTQWAEPGPDGMGALTTQIQHISGQWQRSTGYLPSVQLTPQSMGSTFTYLRRYHLAAALGLAPDEDDDGNAAEPHPAPRAGTVSPSDPAEYVLAFGKHKGKTLGEAGRHYAKYLMDRMDEELVEHGKLSPRDSALYELLSRFLTAHPLDDEKEG